MPAAAPAGAVKRPRAPRSGTEAGMEAHPAPLPSWNSGPVATATVASGLAPHALRSRFPLLLKISCFQQDIGRVGWGELPCQALAISQDSGSPGGDGWWRSPPPASHPLRTPAEGGPLHRPQGFASPGLSKAGHPPLQRGHGTPQPSAGRNPPRGLQAPLGLR